MGTTKYICNFFALLVFKFRWMRFQASMRKYDNQLTSP
jgi:hypothetical protein